MFQHRIQSHTVFRSRLVIAFAVAATLLAACASASPTPQQPQVFFTEPGDGEDVSNPILMQMGAENFTVEPSGEVKEGAGHLHIMVDAPCVEAGQVIPKDDSHIHYGGGQVEAELNLTPGAHTLCLQAANGAHIALSGDGMTHQINLAVK